MFNFNSKTLIIPHGAILLAQGGTDVFATMGYGKVLTGKADGMLKIWKQIYHARLRSVPSKEY